MKKIFIVETVGVILGVAILGLSLVPDGFASKGGQGGGESATLSSCDDGAIAFPTSVYTRLNTHPSGSVSGFEIHLSRAGGDCSVMLYSSNATESRISLDFQQNGDDMAIALR